MIEIPTKFTTEHDALILSCIMYRLKDHQSFSLTDSSFPPDLVTDEDRVLADNIRNHYRSKLVLAALRSATMSKFRTDLSIFLSTDYKLADGTYEYPKNFTGLIYKLPYFYHNDLILRDIFGGDYFTRKGNVPSDGDRKLTFIQKIDVGIRSKPFIEYWFSDPDGNRVQLDIDKHNPLISLFECLLDKEINMYATYNLRSRDNLDFFHAVKWKLQTV